jgi:alcohol dehydrogenase class IV
MPAVLQFNRPAIEGVMGKAAAYLDISGGFDGFCAYVDQLNASMGIPKTLADLGVTNPDLDVLTRSALNDPSVGGNPMEMTYDNTRALYEQLL